MTLSLIVLAAGLGSRFGGVKQVASVDDAGQTLVEYSIFDAVRAGFDRVVCVVTPGLQAEFHARIGRNVARHVELVYAYQTVPAGRTKPYGTAQAVLCALGDVPGSFATINADDFYGADAYKCLATFLNQPGDDHALVGYELENTLSAHGTVSRGVCQVQGGRLIRVTEHTALRAVPGGATDEAGQFYPGDTPVSMNCWGFRASGASAFAELFPAFLARPDVATAEFYLPDVGGALVPHVRVLPTTAVWKGLTYVDDLPELRAHVATLVAAGTYPCLLWP